MQIELLNRFFAGLKDYYSVELVSSDERRDCYIDFVRGLAALSVVYIHTVFWSGKRYIPEWWWDTALLFDVPVFFLLAGMSIGRNRKCSIPGAAFKLSISFTLLIMIADSICGNWNLSNTLSAFFLISGKSNALLGVEGSYWFVPIFISSLIFAEIFIRFYDKYIIPIGCLLLALYPLAQCGLLDRHSFEPVFGLACYIAFVLLGYWLTTNEVADNTRKKIQVCAVLCLIAILFITISCIRIGVMPSLNLQKNKFPVNVSYIGFSLISLIIITACYSVKCRFPKFICKIGKDAIWFYAGQCVGMSLIYKITPLIHFHWSIKLVIAFLCNLVLTFVAAILLQTVYTLLGTLFGLFFPPQDSDRKTVSDVCKMNKFHWAQILVICLAAGLLFFRCGDSNHDNAGKKRPAVKKQMAFRKRVFGVKELRLTGNARREGKNLVLNKGGVQFGPYIQIPHGTYRVRITGKNLDKLRFYCTAEKGKKQFTLDKMKCSGTVVEYNVHFPKTTQRVEFVSRNYQTEPGKICDITLTVLSTDTGKK